MGVEVAQITVTGVYKSAVKIWEQRIRVERNEETGQEREVEMQEEKGGDL